MNEPVTQAAERLNPYGNLRRVFWEQGFMFQTCTAHYASPYRQIYQEGKLARYLWQYGGSNEN